MKPKKNPFTVKKVQKYNLITIENRNKNKNQIGKINNL